MNLSSSLAVAGLLISPLSISLAVAHGEHKSLGERISLSPLSTYKLGPYDSGAAEIVSFDPKTQRAFATNNHARTIDVISLSEPESPQLAFRIDLKEFGTINSVAVKNQLVAIAISGKNPQENGSILVYSTDGVRLNQFQAGAMPDMVTFSPNGQYIVSANEGEPNDDYTVDPEGSITIIDIKGDIRALEPASVRSVNFNQFTDNNIDPEIRIFGKNASIAQDLEPEYISITANSETAWVSLQENNALAEVSLKRGRVEKLYALGYKDHSLTENGLDASDKDNKINIKTWPLRGMYQPDSIASYKVNGQSFIVTANEGDPRDYSGFSEQKRVKNLALDSSLKEQNLQGDKQLGQLNVSTIGADSDKNGLSDTLYSFGSRSFSIWDQNIVQVFDSGSAFEKITARDYPRLFNNRDLSSDDKGPEPEALTIGKVGKSTYAFIGLERTGGIMVYNITVPEKAFFVDYLNTISPYLEPSDPNAGDIAPESLVFINASDSPNGQPLLVSANEVSGTISIYQVNQTEQKDR